MTRLVFSKVLKIFLRFCFRGSTVLHVSCIFIFFSLSPNIFTFFSSVSQGLKDTLTPGRSVTPTRQRSRFGLKWNITSIAVFKRAFRPASFDTWKFKDSQTGSHLGRDDPTQCDEIKWREIYITIYINMVVSLLKLFYRMYFSFLKKNFTEVSHVVNRQGR